MQLQSGQLICLTLLNGKCSVRNPNASTRYFFNYVMLVNYWPQKDMLVNFWALIDGFHCELL